MVHVGWVLLAFVLLTVSELCFSAIGLSAVSSLAPAKNLGLIMGFWFLTVSAGLVLADKLAGLAAVSKQLTMPAQTLPIYLAAFKDFTIVAFGIFIVSLLFVPMLKKLSSPD